MRPWPLICLPVSAAIAALLLTGCERETRGWRVAPHVPAAASRPAASALVPGPGASTASAPAADMPSAAASVVVPMVRIDNRYEGNAYAVSQGKRWYRWYNCNGCHANGGGGMGPALMDAQWLYGSAPGQVAASIVQGRPNGMPAFAGRIPDEQVWQLVAYVRSMSGLVRADVAPGRGDTLSPGREPETRREPATPRNAPPPAVAASR
jgi:cytochrome c oxidase cbb3-type subunit 3